MGFWKDWIKKHEPKKTPGKFMRFYNCPCGWAEGVITEDGKFSENERVCPRCGSEWSKIKTRICRYWFLNGKPVEIETLEHFNEVKEKK